MILIHPNRLAAYSDEISDDPIKAIELAKNAYGFTTICLRRAWTGYAASLNDIALQKLKAAVSQLKVILLSSELGLSLSTIDNQEFEKTFLVANYFGARYLRIHIGVPNDKDLRPAWIKRVGDRAIKANLVPLLEYSPECGNMTAQDILDLVNLHPRWRILYDPAQYVIRRNLDPFEKYWKVLYSKVALFDLRDYKIGGGFKPVGFGDCRIADTIKHAQEVKYGGFYTIEPSLGRRFGTAVSREEIFALAHKQVIDHL